MGKGSKPRPVGKGYGAEIERIFGKRCVHNRDPEKCAVCVERLKNYGEMFRPLFPPSPEEDDICEACGEVHGPFRR